MEKVVNMVKSLKMIHLRPDQSFSLASCCRRWWVLKRLTLLYFHGTYKAATES